MLRLGHAALATSVGMIGPADELPDSGSDMVCTNEHLPGDTVWVRHLPGHPDRHLPGNTIWVKRMLSGDLHRMRIEASTSQN